MDKLTQRTARNAREIVRPQVVPSTVAPWFPKTWLCLCGLLSKDGYHVGSSPQSDGGALFWFVKCIWVLERKQIDVAISTIMIMKEKETNDRGSEDGFPRSLMMIREAFVQLVSLEAPGLGESERRSAIEGLLMSLRCDVKGPSHVLGIDRTEPTPSAAVVPLPTCVAARDEVGGCNDDDDEGIALEQSCTVVPLGS